MKTNKLLYLGLCISILAVFLDQISKKIALDYLDNDSFIEIINNFFYFNLVFNKGAAWGMFQGFRAFFLIAGFFVITFLLFNMYKSIKETNFYILPTFVFIGGVIGNMIDRIRLGKVVDFFDFYILGYNFPVFNIADVFITIGAICLAIVVIFEERLKNNGKQSKKQ